MRVESGRRAVLRFAVEGSPAHTYSTPGSTTRRRARRTAGATVQSRTRRGRLNTTARPHLEQYRLFGLAAEPQLAQNEPVLLTGYIIARGSISSHPTSPEVGDLRGRGG